MLFGDAPANISAVWYPESHTRGSFGILSSCLITLALCVWTSVHLNVPRYREDTQSRWWNPRGWISKQQWRKAGWLILGMLAPEMIAFTAFDQWRSARKLSKVIPNLLEDGRGRNSAVEFSTADVDVELNDRSDSPRRKAHKWTMVHSMFVIMGGFSFATHDVPLHEKFLPGNRDRVTLTPDGFIKLAELEPELIPDISVDEIWDKSKANGLAKGIVCVQATWFIVNTIFRLSEGLAISLLELNTFAHCLYALLSYAFWWNKPLDVTEPSLITGSAMHSICASLCGSLITSGRPIIGFQPYREVSYIPDPFEREILPRGTTLRLSSAPVPAHGQRMILYSGQRIHGVIYRTSSAYDCCGSSLHKPSLGILHHSRPYIEYDSADERRWALSAQSKMHSVDRLQWWQPYVTLDHVRNWPERHGSALDLLRDRLFITGLTFAGLSYGALHLVAWTAPFTTYTESLLWRMSGLTVAASGPVFILLVSVPEKVRSIHGYMYDQLLKPLDEPLRLALIVFWLFYIFVRTYLVVECFISFAHLPEDIVKQPQWSYYFPHIT